MNKKNTIGSRKIIALIPARDGSKSIKHKNIQSLNNLPLFIHSINLAQASIKINEVYFLTNNSWYADIARNYNVDVPYLRSNLSSHDTAEDKIVLEEFIKYFKIEACNNSIVFVWIRPTHPFRDVRLVDQAIDKFIASSFCSMRTVSVTKLTPYKMWEIQENNQLRRIIGEVEDGKHDAPRQTLPAVYWQDGNLDILYPCAINGAPCQFHQAKIGAILSEHTLENDIDLDYPEDFHKAIEFSGNRTDDTQPGFNVLNRKIDGADVKRYGS